MEWNEYTRMFVGLFAIVSPVGVVPLYLSFTENVKQRRPAISRTTAFSVAVVPLAMPLLAGPGSISTVILFSNQLVGVVDYMALFVVCQLVALVIWGILHFAPQIGDRMSQTSMNVLTRVMGLILAAMSVEFIVGGLRNLLPGLA